jgi:single-stranded DNA-binding protein
MLHLLASGTLIAEPQRREGAKGAFATAAIRASGVEGAVVSVIAFQQAADRLLGLTKGDAVSVSGQAKLTSWTSRDGTERRGISVTVEHLITVKPPQSATGADSPQRRAPAPGRRRQTKTASRAVSSAPPRPSGELANDSVGDLFQEAAAQ